MSIDILRKLREVQVPQAQAEAIAEAIESRIRPPDMATKADVADVRTDIEKVRTEMWTEIEKVRTEIEKLRNDLTWRMIGLSAVIIAAVGIIDKVIHG